jgi:hypothetical protein
MTAEIQTLRKQVEIAENEVRNLIPRPSTLNRKPETISPQFGTLNLEPEQTRQQTRRGR